MKTLERYPITLFDLLARRLLCFLDFLLRRGNKNVFCS